MVEIIETYLSYERSKHIIHDHQSRIVFADSWKNYKNTIRNYNGKQIVFKSIDMPGATIYNNKDIYDFKADDFHLSYRVVNEYGQNTLCFAYKRNLEQ